MKRFGSYLIRLLLLGIALVGVTSPASTRELFSVGGGLTLPMEPDAFADFWRRGEGLVVYVPFHQQEKGSLGFTFQWTHYGMDWDDFMGNFPPNKRQALNALGLSGLTVKQVQVGIHQKLVWGKSSRSGAAFIRMGLSFAHTTASDLVAVDNITGERLRENINPNGNHALIDVGLGGDFRINDSLFLWAEGKYNYMFDSSWRIFPLNVGIALRR